jgi:ribosomal protein L16 Arg81 hydroxylase
MLNFRISQEEFSARYLEKQPFLFTAALSERLMTWRDFDQILHSIEPDEQLMQLFQNGQVPFQNFVDQAFELGRTRRRLNKHHFYSLLRGGATLVLNRSEDFSIAAKCLCTAVARFVGQPTMSNTYVSFSGTGTFGDHWDTHDVFAIQLIGKKRWQLFSPTLPLPLSHQTSNCSGHSCPSTPVLDCVLSIGDVLYIPRGWWHRVTPLAIGSLHVSVGSYVPTLFDYVMWLSSQQLPELIDARRGLNDLGASTPGLTAILQRLSTAMADPNNLRAFTNTLHARERLVSSFQTEMMLSVSALPSTASLTLTSYRIDYGGADEIVINGRRLKLTPISHAVVALLNQTGSSRFSELCAALTSYSPTALSEAVLDLGRFDVVTINDSPSN